MHEDFRHHALYFVAEQGLQFAREFPRPRLGMALQQRLKMPFEVPAETLGDFVLNLLQQIGLNGQTSRLQMIRQASREGPGAVVNGGLRRDGRRYPWAGACGGGCALRRQPALAFGLHNIGRRASAGVDDFSQDGQTIRERGRHAAISRVVGSVPASR
ncbi:hypothetical protein THIARS_61078 [Thiomonas delicata]|uniref:Uncharacterized protein n=1 Tax=Thiomonas delicata TaxID=364030 RepID=A0A238D554_THIDL|nr:hypothetical protein THIARS_61078 [Thiomonas delicata]